MKVAGLHSWQVTVDQALTIQKRLAEQVSRTSEVTAPRFIAGVDIAVNKRGEMATAAVVVLNYPELSLAETKVVKGNLGFSYIPGLLSFRESPLILAACEELSLTPDLVMVDGQGIAHPRRMGIASHLGLLLNVPTIGCAKSRLCGRHDSPGTEAGDYSELVDKGEVIGVALRTKPGAGPLYISIGHKIDLSDAIGWVLKCCRGHRLPEPTRLAHLAAGGNLQQEVSTDAGQNKSCRPRLFA